MSITYILSRIGVFVLIVWIAITLIFFLPRLAGDRNPVREKLIALAASGSRMTGMEKVVEAYERDYGLDQPLYVQYLRYMSSILRFDLGVSLVRHPTSVIDLILQRLPWTLGLVGVSLLISFVLGTLAGALLAWPGSPRSLKAILPIFLTLSPIPYFMLAFFVVLLFAITLAWFPIAGASRVGTIYEGWDLARVWDIVRHSFLPALSIVLSQVGFWALGMRGMMVTTAGEDYVTLAQMRGLSPTRIFGQYAMRNAMLPQLTSLALALSLIVSGVILVEYIFRYPGMGSLLFDAIALFDYFTIYGVVLVLILFVASATLILDLVYPLIDPRVRRTV